MSKSFKEQARERFQDKRDAKKVKHLLARKADRRERNQRWDVQQRDVQS